MIEDVVYVSNEQICILPLEVRRDLLKKDIDFRFVDRVRGSMVYQPVPREMAHQYRLLPHPGLTKWAQEVC